MSGADDPQLDCGDSSSGHRTYVKTVEPWGQVIVSQKTGKVLTAKYRTLITNEK